MDPDIAFQFRYENVSFQTLASWDVLTKQARMEMTARSVAVVGPTASGKTGRAVDLAKVLGGEIVSADSRQVYRQMDLGTGKDLEDYDGVPYHLIDIRDLKREIQSA